MKYQQIIVSMMGALLVLPASAAQTLNLKPLPEIASDIPADSAATPSTEAEAAPLRFEIKSYTVEGARLLKKAELDELLAPFVGKSKDFSDVQLALEAVEETYANQGYSAVSVILPEQELEKGNVLFQVIESHFGKVTVRDNRFFSTNTVLNALPSVRAGGIPRSKQIARELKLANENPARQMNVVLKSGEQEREVDASVVVTDVNPLTWGASLDNSGSAETGQTRLGISFRHANLLDQDHVVGGQFQMSPERPDRVTVLGGTYKIPLYGWGDSLEFFGGYSNVNSVVGGLGNFQGGGVLFNARYNHPLEKIGTFEPRLIFGIDWRDFKKIVSNSFGVTSIINNEIVVVPLSITYTAQGKLAKSDVGFNAAYSRNLPGMKKGNRGDFSCYFVNAATQICDNTVQQPDTNYQVLRYGANYSTLLGEEWQLRAVLSGQLSNKLLIQGEQFRLGGMDAVRGFSEGSEGGESGARATVEGYSPDIGKGDLRARGLVFFDAGQISAKSGVRSSISSAGLGIRASYNEQFSLRADAARIINAGTDPLQRVGDWRLHLSLSASF